jgi:hypothetical protein
MANTPMKNVRIAPNPLNINLPDGKMVHSTHICDVEIPGLPHMLEGHIIPALNVATLIGIRILCKVGCQVVFADTACYIKYNGRIIVRGTKDPSTDLWVLPLTSNAISTSQRKLWTSQGEKLQSQTGPGMACAPQSPKPFTPAASVAMFMHLVRTQANTVKFGHQAMCKPKISSLLKAVRKGFLKGCPNLSEDLVTNYLKPKPSHSQRTYETSEERDQKHNQESQNKG